MNASRFQTLSQRSEGSFLHHFHFTATCWNFPLLIETSNLSLFTLVNLTQRRRHCQRLWREMCKSYSRGFRKDQSCQYLESKRVGVAWFSHSLFDLNCWFLMISPFPFQIVNNAGFTNDKMAHTMDDETFQLMIDVHCAVSFDLASFDEIRILSPLHRLSKGWTNFLSLCFLRLRLHSVSSELLLLTSVSRMRANVRTEVLPMWVLSLCFSQTRFGKSYLTL